MPHSPHANPPDDHATHLLRHAGLRVTGIRLEVLGVLARTQSAHPGRTMLATEVAGSLPDADRVTVYRTLGTLVDAGIAHRVDVGDRLFRFGLTDHAHCRGEAHDHEHPHLVCDACGVVQCLDNALVTIQPRAGGQPGRWQNIRQQDVTLHGTCARCGPAAAAPRTTSRAKRGTGGTRPRPSR